MNDDLKKRVLEAFFLVMRPLVKILFRYGVSYREFSEVAKTAFVDIASSEFGIRGRPTNISRVAVITGLTRKEVRRIRDELEKGQYFVSVKSTPMAEVLSRWHAEQDFLDSSGRPKALQFSKGEGSFSDLVRKFGGDVPPGAMRTELKRVGSIEEDDKGRLKMKSRTVIPADQIDKLLSSLVHGVYPLLATIETNTNSESAQDVMPQFTAYSLRIRDADLARLRRISHDRLSDTAESFDDLFIAYESLNASDGDDRENIVSVGLFYFEERDTNAKYTW
jgi:hypothetical protein